MKTFHASDKNSKKNGNAIKNPRECHDLPKPTIMISRKPFPRKAVSLDEEQSFTKAWMPLSLVLLGVKTVNIRAAVVKFGQISGRWRRGLKYYH